MLTHRSSTAVSAGMVRPRGDSTATASSSGSPDHKRQKAHQGPYEKWVEHMQAPLSPLPDSDDQSVGDTVEIPSFEIGWWCSDLFTHKLSTILFARIRQRLYAWHASI